MASHFVFRRVKYRNTFMNVETLIKYNLNTEAAV